MSDFDVIATATCTIQRAAETGSDATGDQTFGAPEAVADDVPCHFDDAGTVMKLGGASVVLENPRLFVGPAVDLREGDLIVNVTVAGVVRKAGPYRVIGITDPGLVLDHFEADLERVG